jgi:hypothetical protein
VDGDFVRRAQPKRRKEISMSSMMAPNVRSVGASGRRTVYSMCGMCAVRCPIEVTVDDGRVAWLQDNPHEQKIVLSAGMATRNLGAALAPLFALTEMDQRATVMIALGFPIMAIFALLAAKWFGRPAL